MARKLTTQEVRAIATAIVSEVNKHLEPKKNELKKRLLKEGSAKRFKELYTEYKSFVDKMTPEVVKMQGVIKELNSMFTPTQIRYYSPSIATHPYNFERDLEEILEKEASKQIQSPSLETVMGEILLANLRDDVDVDKTIDSIVSKYI
jgi:hypothetical protein